MVILETLGTGTETPQRRSYFYMMLEDMGLYVVLCADVCSLSVPHARVSKQRPARVCSRRPPTGFCVALLGIYPPALLALLAH